jgi:hypothetical protein
MARWPMSLRPVESCPVGQRWSVRTRWDSRRDRHNLTPPGGRQDPQRPQGAPEGLGRTWSVSSDHPVWSGSSGCWVGRVWVTPAACAALPYGPQGCAIGHPPTVAGRVGPAPARHLSGGSAGRGPGCRGPGPTGNQIVAGGPTASRLGRRFYQPLGISDGRRGDVR